MAKLLDFLDKIFEKDYYTRNTLTLISYKLRNGEPLDVVQMFTLICLSIGLLNYKYGKIEPKK